MRKFIAVGAVSVVALVGLAGCSSSSGSAKSTTTTAADTTTLSGWAGAFCTKIAPSAGALETATKAAVASDSSTNIAAVLTSTTALLQAVSSEMTALGAPPITNGDTMVTEYPRGIAQAIATVNAVAADVQRGTVTSLDQVGSIDVESSLSSAATGAWDQVEASMKTTPACTNIPGILDNNN